MTVEVPDRANIDFERFSHGLRDALNEIHGAKWLGTSDSYDTGRRQGDIYKGNQQPETPANETKYRRN